MPSLSLESYLGYRERGGVRWHCFATQPCQSAEPGGGCQLYISAQQVGGHRPLTSAQLDTDDWLSKPPPRQPPSPSTCVLFNGVVWAVVRYLAFALLPPFSCVSSYFGILDHNQSRCFLAFLPCPPQSLASMSPANSPPSSPPNSPQQVSESSAGHGWPSRDTENAAKVESTHPNTAEPPQPVAPTQDNSHCPKSQSKHDAELERMLEELKETRDNFPREQQEVIAKLEQEQRELRDELGNVREEWRQAIDELSKRQAEDREPSQWSDSDLIEEVKHLRYTIESFAILSVHNFEQDMLESMRSAKVRIPPYFHHLLATAPAKPTYLEVLKTKVGHAKILEAFVWNVLTHEVFGGFHWAGKTASRSVRELRQFLQRGELRWCR